MHTGHEPTPKGVRRPFEIYPGVVVPPGTYDTPRRRSVFMTNRARRSVSTCGRHRRQIRRRPRTLNRRFRFRVGETFNDRGRVLRNDVDLPQGDFDTNLLRLRLSYSFTPRLFCRRSSSTTTGPTMVHQPPPRLAPDGEHRPVHRLQREPRPDRAARAGRPQPHDQVQPGVRPAEVAADRSRSLPLTPVATWSPSSRCRCHRPR